MIAIRKVHALLASSSAVLALACASSEPSKSPMPDDGPAQTNPATSSTSTSTQPAPPSTASTASTPEPSPAPGPVPTQVKMTAKECFKSIAGPVPGPDYDQYQPTITPSCAGTHHQNITGVERVVFLGDSITTGTPPTPIKDFYRSRLMDWVHQTFGPNVTSSTCSGWGQRINDLLDNDDEVKSCFPGGVESKKTLVVMTVGGNDIASWAKNKLGPADAVAQADLALGQLRTAIDWLKSPDHFPNGSYVVFGNVYEYTDTSGDLSSCLGASLSGFSGSYADGKQAVVHLEEGYMKIAVETKTDMMFLLEHFCGHGYKRDDPTLQCYRGPNTPLWFDLSCYHPNPAGHEQIALQFEKVIQGL